MYKTKDCKLSKNWRIGFIFDAFNSDIWRVFKPEVTFINSTIKTLILELSLFNVNLCVEIYEVEDTNYTN